MSKRVFAMSGFKGKSSTDINERQDRLDIARDALMNEVLGHPKAQQMGITRDEMENVRNFIGGLAEGRAPTLRHGPSFEARVDSGDTVSLTDDYVNAHGERVLEGYRRNGPLIEKVRIAEERIDPRTVIVNRRLR
jgi:hypothetical protein